jgi:hypothetical protein
LGDAPGNPAPRLQIAQEEVAGPYWRCRSRGRRQNVGGTLFKQAACARGPVGTTFLAEVRSLLRSATPRAMCCQFPVTPDISLQ